PEFADEQAEFLGQSERRRTLALEPLPDEAGQELLAHLLGSKELAQQPEALSLLRNAGGNPLFVEETVSMLSDAGMVDRGGWRRGDDGAESLTVPTSLQSLLASRLDQLRLPEKQIAQHASVAGAV